MSKLTKLLPLAILAGGILFALALLLGAAAWMAYMPGDPVPQRVEAPDPAIQSNLTRHVAALAFERHTRQPERLDEAAAYVERALHSLGYAVRSQWFEAHGVRVRNLDVSIAGRDAQSPLIVIGAHYDSARGTPGADDNASGVAALLELARLFSQSHDGIDKEIRLVFFTNEEPPHFRSYQMGSFVYAEALAAQQRDIDAMLSLEMLGYYCDAPDCQRYPFPHAGVFPDRGNFIGFVGNLESRSLVQRVIGTFRAHASIPSEGISAPPSMVTGIDFSDQLWFWHYGYPAVMVTDTSFMRYAHYHDGSDTPDRLDYARMAHVVAGLEHVVRELAASRD